MTRAQESDDLELRERLRALRTDPADDGFSASLHRRLAAEPAPEEPGLWRRFWQPLWTPQRALWPAVGVAAAFAFVVGAGLLHRPVAGVREDALVAAELPATKVALVRVNLSASVAVDNAQIRVRLPEGLVFWSEGRELAQRSFEWTQPLDAGDNEIPIAVRGLKPGRYNMTVTARIGGQDVNEDVLLEVVDG